MTKKNSLLTLIILLSATTVNAQQTNKKTADKPPYEFVLDLMKEYSPETYHMFTRMSNPREYSGALGTERNLSAIVDHMGTFIHESCHDYDFDIQERTPMSDEGYYIDPQHEIAVFFEKVVNSYELNKVVPDSLKEKMLRYDTYIGDKQIFLGAQKNGIYGLAEEMCAYYRGAIAYFDLKPWYEKTYGYAAPEPWVKEFIPNIGGQLTGFYEFRLFMAWYLDYIKKKYPEKYKEILANDPFREAFTLLYDRGLQLAAAYEEEVYRVEAALIANGLNVKVQEKYFQIIKPGEPIYGTGHHLESIRWLKSLFTPDLEGSLMVLRN